MLQGPLGNQEVVLLIITLGKENKVNIVNDFSLISINPPPPLQVKKVQLCKNIMQHHQPLADTVTQQKNYVT